jgi:peptidyl-prolyl cis-trans isomerase C
MLLVEDDRWAKVKATAKGTLVDKPVKTQFGWHVIEVEDTRPVEVPSFEKVRPQMEEMLRQQTLAKYQQELRQKAKVQ